MEIQFTYYEVEAARGPMHEVKKNIIEQMNEAVAKDTTTRNM